MQACCAVEKAPPLVSVRHPPYLQQPSSSVHQYSIRAVDYIFVCVDKVYILIDLNHAAKHNQSIMKNCDPMMVVVVLVGRVLINDFVRMGSNS